MNILHKISFICFLIGSPVIAHCQGHIGGKGGPVKLTRDNSGKKLIITKDRTLILSLPGHVDGGYRFNKAQYNVAVLRLIKHTETPPGANSQLGCSGRDVWQFVAIKKGISTFTITATRPWAGGGTIIIFSDIIIVK